uniref:Uncharacterized protein n=1 Tax=viral metagenome TaxID=1070528 RepID=A0A6C0BS57_9ZZZZ
MGFGNVIFKIITAAGGLYSTTHMGAAPTKHDALELAFDKGRQLSDINLREICSEPSNYVYEQGENGDHFVTCKIPDGYINDGSRGGRNMLGIKSKKTKKRKPAKKSKKTKKRKTKSLKKKRKQTKKRKTRRN